MSKFYKRINKSEFAGISRAEKSYEEMKTRVGVIVSTDEQGEFILVPTEMLGEYVISHVSRADVRSAGFDPSKATDDEMQELADALEDKLTSDDYYEFIADYAFDNLNLPRIHHVVKSDYGEVCLEPSSDGFGYFDAFIGDDFDDYVGTLYIEGDDLSNEEFVLASVNGLFKDEAE